MSTQTVAPQGRHQRVPVATSIRIDRERWSAAFWRRRLTMSSVGPLIGRSTSWANAMAHKGHACYWTLDELATELGMHVDLFIQEVGTDEERSRISVI